MSKGKTALIVGGILVVVIAAGVIVLLQNLDSLVKAGIEKYGSEAAGTQVAVQSVKISLREGSGTVSGLSVANPPGYSQAPVFTLGEIVLDLDTTTLTAEVPVIEEIRIGQTRFLFEINDRGESNLDVLKRNLKSSSAPAGESRKTEGESAPFKLRVTRLSTAEGTGVFDLTAVGGKVLEAKVPAITLTHIGGRDGITPENLSDVVLTALLRELEKAAARQGVEQILRDRLGDRGAEVEKKIDLKLGTGASDQLKKLLGN
jgi:hypothetical protein